MPAPLRSGGWRPGSVGSEKPCQADKGQAHYPAPDDGDYPTIAG
jgi:hypothetical protein